MLYDSHAHLDHNEFSEEERREFIARIEEAVGSGLLSYVNDIGFDLPSSRLAAEHAERYPWCYAAVGCHPHDADTFSDEKLEEIRKLAGREKVRAIGEIGLDFHFDNSERDLQRFWFRKQIRLANELKMPIVIHERDAGNECMEILKEEGAFSKERISWFPERPGPSGEMLPDARVLIHCFSGSAETARQYVKLGASISMSGTLTYKNNRRGVETAEQIPLEFLLVETDSPFLTPVPHRGKPNCPPYVEHTARRLAVIKQISFEDAARMTLENAKRFFGVEQTAD